MPDTHGWLEPLQAQIQTDCTLSAHERERRQTVLRDIEARVRLDGVHLAQPHPNRARQFMPFAALKGYHGLAHGREHTPEPRRAMTEELSTELSAALARLSKGSVASVVHYENGEYITTCGIVSEINEALCSLKIVRKHIAFDDIFSIEPSTQPPTT